MRTSTLSGRSTDRKSPIGSGQQMFYVRKRSGSDRMLVTQAFSQDVKVLACVPLFIVGDEENPH
ncbi:hypothetical protein FOH38_00270 [Lysinibacillus fusiformis]|nr:hypothetical protein FOH38_00270 [Lysinibacillus fusiformis]